MRTTTAILALLLVAGALSCKSQPDRLLLDVHHVGPGKVTVDGVADAHRKDLATQDAHDVQYRRYWVDTSSGTIFCLAEAPSADAAVDVHREAHGLLADEVREVVPGILPAAASGNAPLFMDTHQLGPGLKAADVAEAHRKDLAVQARHGVRFLEYWVDEKNGCIHCLVEAPDAAAVRAAHREAHGLVPQTVQPVVEGH